jgi:ubiquinone/menaquinone biosynthesis C-methylase UbiE
MIRSIEEELFLDNVRRLAAGKMTSTMLELVFELDVFPKLQGREVSLAELAEILGLPLWSARVLAQFLCREGLLLYRDERLSNAPAVDPFLIVENNELREIKKSVLKVNLPLEALRQQLLDPPLEHGYQRMGEVKHHLKVNVMRIMWGEELAQRYSFKGHRVLLDVAGASGGVCIGVVKSNPHLDCIVFDLPEAAEFAKQCISEAGAEGAIRFVGGSFFDELPRADVALLSNIIHNWPPEQDRTILAKILQALEPGGALLVKEAFFDDDWTGPMEPVFQAFFMGRDGWQPTYGDVERMMQDTGFVDLERRFNLVIGRKPIARESLSAAASRARGGAGRRAPRPPAAAGSSNDPPRERAPRRRRRPAPSSRS